MYLNDKLSFFQTQQEYTGAVEWNKGESSPLTPRPGGFITANILKIKHSFYVCVDIFLCINQ